MSTVQTGTVTSTASQVERGARFSSFDGQYYRGALHLPGTSRSQTVSTNLNLVGRPVQGASSHDRQGTSQPHSYSSLQTPSPTDGQTDEETQSHLHGQGASQEHSHWRMQIAGISLQGLSPNRDSPPDQSHMNYYSGTYGNGSATEVGPEPVYCPPSLARFNLTPPAAQASWHDAVSTYQALSPSSSSPWQSSSYSALDGSVQHGPRWNSPPSSRAIGTSPTLPISPQSAAGAASTSWPSIPNTEAVRESASEQSDGGNHTATNSKPLSASVIARPGLSRSSLASSSSSTFLLSSNYSSDTGSSVTPTSANVAAASSRAVPEPAALAFLPFTSRSPPTPQSAGHNTNTRNASSANYAARYPQTATEDANTGSIASTTSTRFDSAAARTSPPYELQTHYPASVAPSGASPDATHASRHAHDQAPPESAFQAQLQQSGQAAMSDATISSRTGATASGPPGSGPIPVDYSFTGENTNTGTYPPPFGHNSSSSIGAGPSSLSAPSFVPQPTVPVILTAAEPYDDTLSSSPPPAPDPAEGSSSGHQRKKNHACWMCHKSFDRPSTLRKHLLVHTGEKAFVCTICGRRFGVASNLNRHTRRCIARPVNSSTFHNPPSTSAAGPSSASSSSLPVSETMARESTNPDVRRSERERDGREIRDGDPLPPAPVLASTSEAQQRPTRGRRALATRGRSTIPQGAHPSSPGPSHQTTLPLRPLADGENQNAGDTTVASTSTRPAEQVAEGERRPKRRRRAPSPSRWVPASLRPFSLSPVRTRTSTPLPPVSPGYDSATGFYEERDSFSNIVDENVDPTEATAESSASGAASGSISADNAPRTRAERLRNFELAPYHPCGWAGRLPGPAVVGSDLTNYTKPSGGVSGSGSGRYSGGNVGGGMSFMTFSLAIDG